MDEYSYKGIPREYLKRMKHLVSEYEQIKNKHHPKFRFVSDFYKYNGIKKQNFIKYYNRYKQYPQDNSLLPRKPGPCYKSRRPSVFIEQQVLEIRRTGASRYEIYEILKPKLKGFTPSPSGIYNILKRHGMNRLQAKEKRNKRMIIKSKAGEMGHIDCYHLPSGLLEHDEGKYYLVAVLDDCTRLMWIELIDSIKALHVMFGVLKCLNMLNSMYGVQFDEVLTDNGPEFGSGPKTNNKDEHPFEVLLLNMGIKHRYTKPYRPQTNGKVERFWRTLYEDLLEETVFADRANFEDELQQYTRYYNEIRAHQAIGNKTPKAFKDNL